MPTSPKIERFEWWTQKIGIAVLLLILGLGIGITAVIQTLLKEEPIHEAAVLCADDDPLSTADDTLRSCPSTDVAIFWKKP